MSDMHILKILNEIFGQCHKTGQEYLFFCPFDVHRKRKLSINLNKKLYKCWVCDKKGKLSFLVRKFGTKNQFSNYCIFVGTIDSIGLEEELDNKLNGVEQKDKKCQKVFLPKEFRTLINDFSLSSISARNYLKNRGIFEPDIIKWRMGYCTSGEYKNRIIVPSFDKNGFLNYYVARTYNCDFRKYLNPPYLKELVFNEMNINWSKPLILVEGVFDAIKANKNAIPLLGSTINQKSYLFQRIIESEQDVYLALDDDAKNKMFKIGELFLKFGINVYIIDTSNIEDVGAITTEEFIKLKNKAEKLVFEDYILYRLSLM